MFKKKNLKRIKRGIKTTTKRMYKKLKKLEINNSTLKEIKSVAI